MADHYRWVNLTLARNQADHLELRKRSGFTEFSGLQHTYRVKDIFGGYAGEFDATTIQQIRDDPAVALVEPNIKVHSQGVLGTPHGGQYVGNEEPWGLHRISHCRLPKRGYEVHNKSYTGTYRCSSNRGRGVDVYVLDTGINIDHDDFEGRAYWGITTAANQPNEDNHGHGTHVAGTIAESRYGVAKEANVHAVKVLDQKNSGYLADIIDGLVWVMEQHYANRTKSNFRGSVVNLSFSFQSIGNPLAFHKLLRAASYIGIHLVASAGNLNRCSCEVVPASNPYVITVGASNSEDRVAKFSNYGKCVDIFAPGVSSIRSTWIGSTNATELINGTSMAAPHVSGLIAYLLDNSPKYGKKS